MTTDTSLDRELDHELDYEIEAMLAVEPSPDFVSRVRTRIADTPFRLDYGLEHGLDQSGCGICRRRGSRGSRGFQATRECSAGGTGTHCKNVHADGFAVR